MFFCSDALAMNAACNCKFLYGGKSQGAWEIISCSLDDIPASFRITVSNLVLMDY